MSITFPLTSDITRELPAFEILSDISLLETEDIDLSDALKSAGFKDGQWVKTDANGKLVATDTTAVKNSFCIWTGSENAAEVTPDTKATGKATVIMSGIRGKTKEFTGTPVVGTLLVVKSGKLVEAATDAEKLLAVAFVYLPIASDYLYFKSFK